MAGEVKKRGAGRRARSATDVVSDTKGIRTIFVAAKILKALGEYKNPVRVTDLARKLNMTMPTVSRHLSTWRELGFVDKPEGQETYRLGTELFNLGQAAAEQYAHVSMAYPFLTELRDQVNETTILATRLYDKAIAVACLDSSRPMTLTVRPGTVLELPYSPTARILWAFNDGSLDRLDDVIASTDFSPNLGLTPAGFKKKIKACLKNWYDYDVDVRYTGLGSLSAPVFDHTNDVIACVSVLMPASSLNDPPSQELIDKVKTCASSISQVLGSSNWRQVSTAI